MNYGIIEYPDGTLKPALMMGQNEDDINRQAALFGQACIGRRVFIGNYFCAKQGEEIIKLAKITKITSLADAENFDRQLQEIDEKYKKITDL